MRLFDRRIHLVTGKGGVGRTVVSVALAHGIAHTGRRVLLAEVGDSSGARSAVAPYFGRRELGDVPELLSPGVHGCRLTASTGQELFGRSILASGPLIRAALRSNALRKFMSAAPAFHELGIMYHLLELLEAKDASGRPLHPCIVIDMPATGHAMALADLPEVVLRLVPKGPIARAMKAGQGYLNDPKTTAAWIVTLPEHLPVTEAIELLAGLRRTKVPAGGVLLNRLVPDPFTTEECQALDEILKKQLVRGADLYSRICAGRESTARLRSSVDVPIVHLPEILSDDGSTIRLALTAKLLEGVVS